MPVQPLPDNPSLENLRKQAKGLRKAASANEPGALARIREFHPRPDAALRKFSLHDAQLVVARSYGFTSWSKLKKYFEVVDQHSWVPSEPAGDNSETLSDRFLRLACLTYLADPPHGARRHEC